MSEDSGDGLRYRWECVYCDLVSEETYPDTDAAREAALAHIDESSHGLTTILTHRAAKEAE
ncbi:MAG: hypothetical protein ABEI31_02310 [Halodesulfurarchaeum sp.]